MNLDNLTAKDLRRAATVKERIEDLREQLAEIFGKPGARSIAPPGPRKGIPWTAAQRRKFKATMRARRFHKA
jgi:hypothetical protein